MPPRAGPTPGALSYPPSQGMVAHAFNPRTREAENRESPNFIVKPYTKYIKNISLSIEIKT